MGSRYPEAGEESGPQGNKSAGSAGKLCERRGTGGRHGSGAGA